MIDRAKDLPPEVTARLDQVYAELPRAEASDPWGLLDAGATKEFLSLSYPKARAKVGAFADYLKHKATEGLELHTDGVKLTLTATGPDERRVILKTRGHMLKRQEINEIVRAAEERHLPIAKAVYGLCM